MVVGCLDELHEVLPDCQGQGASTVLTIVVFGLNWVTADLYPAYRSVQVHFSVCALFLFADFICDYGHQYTSSRVHTRTHTHARVWTFSICMQMSIQVHTRICTYAIYLSSYTHINTHTHRTHIIIVICTGSLQRCLDMHDIIVHVIHAGSFCS